LFLSIAKSVICDWQFVFYKKKSLYIYISHFLTNHPMIFFSNDYSWKILFIKIFVLILVFFLSPLRVNADAIQTVGTSGANYSTLKAAFDKINDGTLKGVIVLQLIDNTTESASAVLNASGSGSSSYSSVIVYPTTTGLTISGNITGALINLNGADYFTLDGRVDAAGSTKDLIVANTNTGTSGSTIRYINSAENNTVKYCTLKGSTLSGSNGILLLSTSSSGNGNDGNIIDSNNICGNVGARALNAIFSYGTAGRENNANIISNNNIYDFLSASGSSYGINIASNSSDWTVSGNSLYETTTLIPIGAFSYEPIRITSSASHFITGNYVGGSAPLCGGSAFTVNSTAAHYMCCIYISGGTGFPCTVENNVVQNISYTSGEDNPWDGIFINTGDVHLTANTIGAATGTGSIIISTPIPAATATVSGDAVATISMIGGGSGYTTAPLITFSTSGSTTPATATANLTDDVVTSITLNSGGSGYTSVPTVIFNGQSNGYSTSHGIINNSMGIVNITDNTMGSITTVSSNTYSQGFESIYLRAASGTTTLTNNLIGSLTTPNSINTSSTAALSLQKQDIYGIYNGGGGTANIIGNTIANLTNSYSGTNGSSRARAICATVGSNTIQGNLVRNISSASGQTGTMASASVIGITILATTIGTRQTVSGNTVYDLTNTHATAPTVIYGIYYRGPASGTHTVLGNFIHSLSFSSSNTASDMEGILFNGGLTTCANNIINLGIGINTGCKINGIWDESGSTNNNSIYFNSIYIGGTVSSGATSSTAALWNKANTSTRNYRNNILMNARAGGSTGKHYAIRIEGMANTTLDYNDYYSASGSLGRIATLDKANLAAWKLGTGQDVSSTSIDPGFTVAGSTAVLDYYTSAVLPGVANTGITTDFAGLIRSVIPKMGALERNNYTWEGTTSTDFATASNWLENEVPSGGANLVFHDNPVNQCVLDSNRSVGDITNTQATYKLVINGKQLTINGNLIFTNSAQIDATASSSGIVFAGLIAQSIPSGAFVSNTVDSLGINNSYGLTLNGNLTIEQNLSLSNGSFILGANTLTLNGTINTLSGTLSGGGSTNLIIGGSGAGTTLPAISLNNLSLNRLNGIVLGGSVSIAGLLALTAGTLTVGANILTLSGSSPTRISGTLSADNVDATLAFTNTTSIMLPSSVFAGDVNNLTVNGAGGVTVSNDFTVNGILNLQSTNPISTKGSLDMWDGSEIKTLTMGALATTIGLGEVTGIIKRTTINAGVTYTFGNQYLSVNFPDWGTLPTEMSAKLSIGTAPSWRPGAINRELEVIQTGGSGTKGVFFFHYLDSELNGNDETKLVFWIGLPTNYEYGRSAYNVTDNWVSISNVNVAFYSSSWDATKDATLDEFSALSTLIWNGSLSNSWTSIENWTPNAGPSTNKNIIIPNATTTPNDPMLPSVTEIKSLTIDAEGILDAVTSAQLTINGSIGAWSNVGGTFIPNTSNVIFTNADATMSGTTDFFDVSVATGAALVPSTGNYMRIGGSLNLIETGILRSAFLPNTIEFNGENQTIINPNGVTPGYYHLILSGSGSKTMPASSLSVAGDFTTSGTATVTAGSIMTVGGNISINDGSTFITGNYNHIFRGNLDNSGILTASAGSTITMNGTYNQSITGISITDFENFTIDNSNGVTLFENENVNNVLSLISGNLNVGLTTLGINGTITKTSGFLEAGSTSSLNFGGTSALTIPGDLFFTAPSIHNLTINRTGGITLGNQSMTVNGLLDLTSGTLSLNANTLTLAGSSPVRTSGNMDAGNAGAILAFTNSSAITLPASVFTGDVNNMTVNGTGGVTSVSDFTLNGILLLQSENPSDIKASLDMWDGSSIKTLTMGANAINTGLGDVTGIIKRSTLIAGVNYTFGNPFMSVFLPDIGTLPSEISAKVSIGTAPSWRTGAINRELEIIQTGGSGTKALFKYHFLDAELNGNNEEHLVFWVGLPTNLEYGRSAFNTVDNWICLSNVDMAFFSSSWDATKNITLADYSSTTTLTWNGSLSDSWTSIENWTPSAGPSSEQNIIIPDASTTLNSPSLPAITEIKTLTIDAAGVLNAVSAAQLTINGSDAWNNVGGTFNPNTSNVIFTNVDATISGTTDFNDVTTNAGKILSMTTGCTMRIAGEVTNNGVWKMQVGGSNTVEYNGGSQTIVVPNPETNLYNNLILSGSGTKTLPSTALSILGDFTISGTAEAVAGSGLTFDGNVNIGTGSTFTGGSYDHSLAGNLTNDGLMSDPTGNMTMSGSSGQLISGAGTTHFYDLAIANTEGVSLNSDVKTNNNLTINSGSVLTISAAVNMNVVGNITNNAGASGLVIKANSSNANGTLIFHNAVGSPVSATVEMYSKAAAITYSEGKYSNYKWQFFGIPLRTLVASPTLDGGFVRRYDETGTVTNWIQLVNASTLTPFTGYEITQPVARNYVFEGQLENGDFNSGQLSYTDDALFTGQHIFANPYTAAIDITHLTFGSQTEASVYLYNTGSLQDWTDSSGGSLNGTSPGQYTVAPKLTAGSGGIPAQIPSMQGFLVKALSSSALATFTIPYSAVAVKDTAMQRAPSVNKVGSSDKIFTIIDVKGSRYTDRMWIFTETGCTRGFDNGWDGYKFVGSSLTPQLYAMEANGDFQVDAVDDINNTYLGFQAGEDINYTMTFTHQNMEARYAELYLLDLLDNTIADISRSGTQFSFVAQPTTSPVKRFKLITSSNTDNPETDSQLKIFTSQQTIFIYNLSNTAGDLVLYDMAGQFVQNMTFKANCITAIPLSLPLGAYLVKATTETVKVSKQLILK